MPRPRAHNLFSLALLCALAPLACERSAEPHADENPAAGGAHGHESDFGAFQFLDVQHAAHPNWLDMGDIPLGEVREATVRFKNVEGRPIRIEQVQAGCSCTGPKLSAVLPSGERIVGDMRSRELILTVPPEAVVELELRVDSAQAPVKNKDKIVLVRLTTDSPTTPYLTIEARMRIHAPLQPIPPDIHIERVGVNAGGEGHTDVTPMLPSGELVLDVLEAPQGVSVRIEPRELAGVPIWRLSARVEAPTRLGYQEHWIKLRTSGPGGEGEGRPLSVKLRWTGAPDVEIAPARLLFLRSGPEGQERALGELVTHMPGHRLKVVAHSLAGPDAAKVSASIAPLAPDETGRAARWSIALDPLAPLSGALNGVLVLELDDPQYPRLEVPFVRRG